MRKWLLASTATLALLLGGVDKATADAADRRIDLQLAGTYATGEFNQGAAEIPAYDQGSKRLFVVNGASESIDILDLHNPSTPTLIDSIDVSAYGSPNSVAARNGIVAVAVEAPVVTDPGSVLFFNTGGTLLKQVTVGALPDMLTFSPDGWFVLVANEGEPRGPINPEGSVSIIIVGFGLDRAVVRTASFAPFNSQKAALAHSGVRFVDPADSVAQNLEPEYIAVSEDNKRAWVTLQENNAVAIVDIPNRRISRIVPLGTKNHNAPGQGLDASDRDDEINIANWPVHGMYMPDAITTFCHNNRTFVVTANEGDDRDTELTGRSADSARVNSLTLDPTAFPNATDLKRNANLGRLTVSTIDGDVDGDGDYDALYSFGARSFSIWSFGMEPVSDSGDQLEQITAAALPDDFNSTNDENNSFDNRSDNKGPEPEGVAAGWVDAKPYVFVGLERIGGVAAFDVSNPAAPKFVQYVNNRNFQGDPASGTAGDLGPEGVLFISKAASPTGVPLLVVANEISGTTSVYYIRSR